MSGRISASPLLLNARISKYGVFYLSLFPFRQTLFGCKTLLCPCCHYPPSWWLLLGCFCNYAGLAHVSPFHKGFPGPPCLPLPSFYMMFYYLSLSDITWVVPVSSPWKSKSWEQALYCIQSCITSDSTVPGIWKVPQICYLNNL